MRLSYPDIALHIPRILLPRRDVAFDRWAVIACDQHTSTPEYWARVEELVGDLPSTLNAVFPEVYLGQPERQRRIARINWQMRSYLEDGLLEQHPAGFVLVDRRTPHAESRKGLLVCLDLEQYSYDENADTLIRTTEGTDPERLPPRVEVRRQAPMELPHIMVLIDDPGRTVIEPLFERRTDLPQLYGFELMMRGGYVQGWHVGKPDHIAEVVAALRGLIEAPRISARYDVASDSAPMLYAMGDGNHSFATAHKVWEEAKRQGAPAENPARYALVELVNLHDEGLQFEPIHRVLFESDPHDLLTSLSDYCRAQGSHLEITEFEDRQQWESARADLDDGQHLPFIADRRCGIATIHRPRHQLAVAFLQDFLTGSGEARYHVDYIHGNKTVDELGSRPGNVGFYTQVLDKQALFRTILREGPLPRKSFSLGEAEEKRYYLECRRITE